ncbi:WG repeat-containing protein, partial [Bacteroides sp. OttesenSCG-928-E20]|nr:WG repeat-containing protein [Bacteroides sp. OttesenSCG-928-E20]
MRAILFPVVFILIISCNNSTTERGYERLILVTLNDKYGFVNEQGKEVVPCKYNDANSLQDGIANVCSNNKWGIIDASGKEIVPCKYD